MSLEKVKTIRTVLDGVATRDEFLEHKNEIIKATEMLIDFIKKIKQQNFDEIEIVKQQLMEDNQRIINESLKEVDLLKQELINKMASVRSGTDGKDGVDGKNADEEKIIKKLLKKLPKELNGKMIRDMLEKLKGRERLRMSAIRGIKDELKKAKKTRTEPIVRFGGGFNYGAMNIHILDPYTPTGDINGVNTDFVLSTNPNPTASLKVYLDGQKMKLTTDYTLSDRTITFLTAPLTGSSVEVEHRV